MAENVQVVREVGSDWKAPGWRLWLQWCEYHYANSSHDQRGYRFVWKRPDGTIQPARLPSLAEIERLIAKAREAGWGDLDDGEAAKRTPI